MKAVMILLDSVCRRFLNCYGSTEPAFTPNLDRLAARGTVFNNHWCGSAPCMPARRDMLTGRTNFLEKPWGAIEPFDQPIPKMLATGGVFSHIVTDHYHYIRIGGENYLNAFTTYELIRGQEKDPWKYHPRAQGQTLDRPDEYLGTFAPVHEDNMKMFREEASYPTPTTLQHAADWLSENADADNFFLWAEGFDPHEPFDVPQKYLNLYREEDAVDEHELNYWPPYRKMDYTPEQVRHLRIRYKALLSMSDAYIGKILDVLDEKDLWKDTMVIFTTDHGYMLGEHGFWSKNYMPAYNEVFNLPLIIWHPEAKVRSFNGITQNIDLYPTLMDAFRISPDVLNHPVTGKDLMPALKGETDSVRTETIYGYFGKSVNYTDGRYIYFCPAKDDSNRPLYVYTAMPTTSGKYYGIDSIRPEDYSKIETGHLAYTDYPVFRIPADIIDITASSSGVGARGEYNTEALLFDLKTDPLQEHPIHDEAIEKACKEGLKRCMKQYGAPPEQFERLGL